MKGIKCCAECAGYSLKKHKCTYGAKNPGKATDSFYSDCPLDDAEPVRHGRWIAKLPYDDESVKDLEFQIVCSRCDEQNASINFNDSGEIIGKTFYKTRFCPNCGAKMDLRTPTEAQLDEADSVMMGGADNG